jgi:hypothetical protein
MADFDHKAMFEDLARSEGVTVRYKNESWLMKLIGALMFFNRDFMRGFVTTIGETVYFPTREGVANNYHHSWSVLAHECVHANDYRENKALFMLGYVMPQGLALLALLAPVLWSWWPLLALVCLLPLPAPWRKESEMRGYAMSMAVIFWYGRSGIPQAEKARIAESFTGSEYYFSWPFKGAVDREIGRWSKRILCNEMHQYGAVYGRVKAMIEQRLKA